MSAVKRTERGWAGHFCCALQCRFRRNTLLEYEDKKWVVSTVGCMTSSLYGDDEPEQIGADRYYETMAFEVDPSSKYLDADVSKMLDFKSNWGLFADSWRELLKEYPYPDKAANDMHEAVVAELTQVLYMRRALE